MVSNENYFVESLEVIKKIKLSQNLLLIKSMMEFEYFSGQWSQYS
jgi:hypothetical protein